MSNHFTNVAPELRQIADNPGTTVEELREQVKTLSSIISSITRFLDDDLAGKITNDLKRKERLRSH